MCRLSYQKTIVKQFSKKEANNMGIGWGQGECGAEWKQGRQVKWEQL